VNQLHRYLVLAGVLVGTGALSAYACQTDNSPRATTPRAEPAAAQNRADPHAVQPDEGQGASGVVGQVMEIIQVDRYTYLRLTQEGGEEVWAAVPSAEIEEGQRVAIANPQLMRQFKSNTLDRTFDEIYFGLLASPNAQGPGGTMPPGHPGTPGSPHAGSDPHGKGASAGDSVEIGEVAKATGPGAHTIAELFAAKQGLAGTKVRVRGVVVKAVANVMNRSFVHLRDGTGDAESGTHDVTVTMAAAPPEVGDQVMVEGTVATNRDFGAGYTYPLLIEDSQLVNE
jgi:hypothetical protein